MTRRQKRWCQPMQNFRRRQRPQPVHPCTCKAFAVLSKCRQGKHSTVQKPQSRQFIILLMAMSACRSGTDQNQKARATPVADWREILPVAIFTVDQPSPTPSYNISITRIQLHQAGNPSGSFSRDHSRSTAPKRSSTNCPLMVLLSIWYTNSSTGFGVGWSALRFGLSK